MPFYHNIQAVIMDGYFKKILDLSLRCVSFKNIWSCLLPICMLMSISIFILMGCSKDDEEAGEVNASSPETFGEVDISVLSVKFNTDQTSFSVSEKQVTISSKGIPNHASVYFETTHSLYEVYNVDGFLKNPNKISTQNITMIIPRYPVVASEHEETPLGTMGIAVNSVSLYNQYAAPGDDLENEIPTFDQWSGHPQNQGQYHYHLEAPYLTEQNGNEGLVGLLLDGFPLYGTHENGVQITNDDLDQYHGHTGVTADFPQGIYHYHVTAESPYMNGNGFYGQAGTITN